MRGWVCAIDGGPNAIRANAKIENKLRMRIGKLPAIASPRVRRDPRAMKEKSITDGGKQKICGPGEQGQATGRRSANQLGC